jgi:predicted component of type VI protein secretion system
VAALALHLARENVFAVAPQVNRDPGQESQARFEADGKLNFAEYFLCFSISPNFSSGKMYAYSSSASHSTIQPSDLTLV